MSPHTCSISQALKPTYLQLCPPQALRAALAYSTKPRPPARLWLGLLCYRIALPVAEASGPYRSGQQLTLWCVWLLSQGLWERRKVKCVATGCHGFWWSLRTVTSQFISLVLLSQFISCSLKRTRHFLCIPANIPMSFSAFSLLWFRESQIFLFNFFRSLASAKEIHTFTVRDLLQRNPSLCFLPPSSLSPVAPLGQSNGKPCPGSPRKAACRERPSSPLHLLCTPSESGQRRARQRGGSSQLWGSPNARSRGGRGELCRKLLRPHLENCLLMWGWCSHWVGTRSPRCGRPCRGAASPFGRQRSPFRDLPGSSKPVTGRQNRSYYKEILSDENGKGFSVRQWALCHSREVKRLNSWFTDCCCSELGSALDMSKKFQ